MRSTLWLWAWCEYRAHRARRARRARAGVACLHSRLAEALSCPTCGPTIAAEIRKIDAAARGCSCSVCQRDRVAA